MSDQLKTGFTFALETVKQLLLLSTGVLTLTITFFDKFQLTKNAVAQWLMAISWVIYLLSIAAGLLTLLALTGTLAAAGAPSITGVNVTRPAKAQVILFAIGLALTAVAGMFALSSPPAAPQT